MIGRSSEGCRNRPFSGLKNSVRIVEDGRFHQSLPKTSVVPVFFRVSKQLVKPAVLGVEANPLGRLSSRDLSLKRDPTSTDAPGMPAAAQLR